MAQVSVVTKDMSHDEWLQNRRSGIGGSDAGAIMGVNPYMSALDLYNDKLGITPPKDLSDNQAVHFGNVLEDVVAQEYTRRTGIKVRRRNAQFAHAKYPWMLANIDRDVVGEPMLLECKTAGAYFKKDEWGPSGTDQVPMHYYIQCAHYMCVMGYERADLAVLIGGRDFRIYHIEKDKELEEMLIEKEANFWNNHVLKQIPPEPETKSDIEQLYGIDDGTSVEANISVETSVIELNAVKEEIKRLKGEQDRLETNIKGFMKEHTTLVDATGSPLATWKASSGRKTFDAKAFQKEHADLYSQYIKVSPGSRRFTVK